MPVDGVIHYYSSQTMHNVRETCASITLSNRHTPLPLYLFVLALRHRLHRSLVELTPTTADFGIELLSASGTDDNEDTILPRLSSRSALRHTTQPACQSLTFG